jgi:hypothetical protein
VLAAPRHLTTFDFAIAFSGPIERLSIPGRAEVIGMDTVRACFGEGLAQPLPEAYPFDERFVFTHFVGSADGGFLLGQDAAREDVTERSAGAR